MNSRNFHLDQLKAVACLVIVLHHLAFYGPMADVLRPWVPQLIAALDTYGRMAVQVFLVLGGYFAAAGLAPEGTAKHAQFWRPLGQRFVRLSLPYSAALVFAIAINETVSNLGYEHYSVSATPDWRSLLAHLFLLQSMADFESLSAGVWYVAIDFQLYAVCLLWFWISRHQSEWQGLGQAGIVVLSALSLLVWNLNAALDIWALYFIGAYGLGMMAWWATHAPNRSQAWAWVLGIALLGVCALALAWRDRIAVAVATALAVAIAGNLRWPAWLQQWQWQPLSWLGQRSYSVFLIHFPIMLLVSSEVHHSWPHSVLANSLGMLLSMVLSIAAGEVLYELTERARATWLRLHGWQIGALLTGLLAGVLELI